MKVYIKNLYGFNDGKKAYYRKLGLCFDFVNSKQFASDLTKEEAEKVLAHGEWYKKQYNASEIGIENEN